ncbi:MAG: nucleotidyltransferase domain-containing protein [Deferrisomatales bacterium]
MEKIRMIFSAHPQVQRVVVYGSRAKGTHRPGSDIDLTLFGPDLGTSELLKIDLELDELLLPYTIDLSIHDQISSRELLEHIGRVGKVLYEKAETVPREILEGKSSR